MPKIGLSARKAKIRKYPAEKWLMGLKLRLRVLHSRSDKLTATYLLSIHVEKKHFYDKNNKKDLLSGNKSSSVVNAGRASMAG